MSRRRIRRRCARRSGDERQRGRGKVMRLTHPRQNPSKSKSKSKIASSLPRSSKTTTWARTCTAPSAKIALCSAGRRRRVCAVRSSTSVRPAGLCECYGEPEWLTWSSKMGKKLCIRCTKAEIWYCTLLYRGQVVVAV